MTRNPPPRTCAVCIKPIHGAVYTEMLDGRGPYTLGACCHTPDRAVRTEDRIRGRPRTKSPLQKSADARTYRAELREQGYCYSARSHGPRTHGVFCEACALRSSKNAKARYARLKAAA